MLGDRGNAIETLSRAALAMPGDAATFPLALQALSIGGARELLRLIARRPGATRWLIQGAGVAGDPAYIEWLAGYMTHPATARIAGEAFTLITGADLAHLGLAANPPQALESRPTDDPGDNDVSIDPDSGLPWPDSEKVQCWWTANGHRFRSGQRYFMGAPVTRDHCLEVLNTGYQRQRLLAAQYLCLLNPGTPLFNTCAPAWRQQRLLAQMT
jgi:uncharacterized protein (TIGR02270 family)